MEKFTCKNVSKNVYEFDENEDMFKDSIETIIKRKVVKTDVTELVEDKGCETKVVQEMSEVLQFAGCELQSNPVFHPFARQHTSLSAIADITIAGQEVDTIDFPCVGAEMYTKKYDANVSYNVSQGVKVIRTNDHFMSSAQLLDEKMPEAVVFSITTRDGVVRSFIWDDVQIRSKELPYPMYLRRRGGSYINYTSDYRDNEIVPYQHMYVGLNKDRSYYVWVDGYPLYLPQNPTAVLTCGEGFAKDSSGNIYMNSSLRGNYICDLKNKDELLNTNRPADSEQFIRTMLMSTWTTGELIEKYPCLEDDCDLLQSMKVKVIDEVDTLYRSFQIKRKGNVRAVEMAKISLKSPSLNFFQILSSMKGHFVGSVAHDGYRGNSNVIDIIQYEGLYWTRERIKGSRKIMLRRNKIDIASGVWYQIPFEYLIT